ncbi:MAG: acetyl-CoA carboxylase biotin carboxyl carrier protein subunit [Promethearchaeota archaeon]|jgi:acetyl/propionyl-CoA carboxylase alpha subunit
MQKRVKFRGREYIITPLDDGKLKVDNHIYLPIVIRETERLYRVTFEDCQFNLELIDGKLFLEGEEIDIEIKPYLKSVDNGAESHIVKKIIVRAPIPGKILQILVKEQELVKKEQLILVLEAMKMKNRILSPITGIITQIYVNIEENVSQDQQLIKIENTI